MVSTKPDTQKVKLAKIFLKSLGINPDEANKNSAVENPQTKAEYWAWCLNGGFKKVYRETNSWPAGKNQIITGRNFRLGQLVWVHDRMDKNHPIIAKAIICQFDEDNYIEKIGNRNYIYSNTHTHYITDQEKWEGTKLYCLEPIKEKDQSKTASEMQAEREEAKIRCMEAESQGLITIRQISKGKNDIENIITIFGVCSELIKEKIGLWSELIKQICKDEGLANNEIEKLQPWTTLSPKACEIFRTFETFEKTHTIKEL